MAHGLRLSILVSYRILRFMPFRLAGCSHVRPVNGEIGSMSEEYYTTGDVAKICGISRATIVNYCNAGSIKAIQSPLTHFRRISKSDLVAFLQAKGLSLSLLEDSDK